MDIVIKIAQFILSFSLLIIVHELGHFLFARMFGIRVEKFYLFFNPWFSLLKFKIGNTEYGIGWIPFGGYVKIAGMVDESMDKEQMKKEPQKDEFRSKPAWQRLFVMLGGVIMNLLMAVCIYIGMSWTWGERYIANDDIKMGWMFNELARDIGFENGDRIITVGGEKVENFATVYAEIVINNAPDVVVLRGAQRISLQIPRRYVERMFQSDDFMVPRIPFVIGKVMDQSGAMRAGLMAGDSLISIDGVEMTYFDQFKEVISRRESEQVELGVIRQDKEGVDSLHTIMVQVSERGEVGIQPRSIANYVPIQTKQFSFTQSIGEGVKRTGMQISNYWKQLKLLIKPDTGAHKSLGGPIAIANIFPKYWDWEGFWSITAFLSLVLAVMNMLPIPGLDGGHVMFVLYEMITGRKPSDRFMEYALLTGMLLLFALIIYATGNDIIRVFVN